jgi:gluconolactonase
MTLYARSAAFWELVDPTATLRQIGSGFTFTEGPMWHPLQHYLVFSDMPGDVRRSWDPQTGVREVKRPANKCNGMTYDGDLNLIVCEHSTSSLIRERPDGRREVLASHFEGKELNSPNDVCVRSDGSVYFSDPWYGRMPVFGIERERELGWQGVFRVPPGGGGPELVVERDTFDMPNGLCFSPDEKLLYINDTTNALVRVYDVAADGSLSGGRVFADGLSSEQEAGVPDGMKCDERGNIWVTSPGGVWVFDPAGEHLGVVRVPELVANLSWGGPDWHTLFLAASTSVYAIDTVVGPHVEPYMRSRGSGTAAAAPPPDQLAPSQAAPPEPNLAGGLRLDPARCALLVQDLQNDVISEGGAFAESGAPAHAAQQNVVANVRRLADICRAKGIPVIHVWFLVDPGARGLTQNSPLFEGVRESGALARGTWGGAPVDGLERVEGDYAVEKMRMSAWEGTQLETVLKATGRDTIIDTGAWTNMSIEHTARTGADKGYTVIVPEDCCSTMNADWHNASINYAMQNVATVTSVDEVIAALA